MKRKDLIKRLNDSDAFSSDMEVATIYTKTLQAVKSSPSQDTMK